MYSVNGKLCSASNKTMLIQLRIVIWLEIHNLYNNDG